MGYLQIKKQPIAKLQCTFCDGLVHFDDDIETHIRRGGKNSLAAYPILSTEFQAKKGKYINFIEV